MEDREDQPLYRHPSEINEQELQTALHALCFLGDDLYLRMQATNVAVVDLFVMGLEYEVLNKLLQADRTPGIEALFVGAQSQMWIFAVYELLRTWRERVKDLLTLSRNGGLQLKLSALEKNEGASHLGREIRAKQVRAVLNNPSLVERVELHLRASHIPFRRIEWARVMLAKHQIPKREKSAARTPGYGRINQWCGSLDYELENGMISFGTISRRDIADEIRAMHNGDAPSDEEIERFDRYVKMSVTLKDPFDEPPG